MAFLRKGDTVAIIAPSSPQPKETFLKAIESVENKGLKPKIYPSCYASHGYLAGADSLRANDFTSAFKDDSVDGVIAVRGGYGAHRLMYLIDWNAVAKSQKPLYGYSDITALHLMLNSLGIQTFHTPMPGTEWVYGLDPFTDECLDACLFGPLPDELVNPPGSEFVPIVEGRARGQLIGGNIMLMSSTLGTPFEIDTRGKIVFFEEVDEAPSAIDRMILQMRHAGKFDEAAGVLIGGFENCVPKEGRDSLTIDQLLFELLGDLNIPVLSGFMCGHVSPTASLPFTATVEIDTSSNAIAVIGY
ncbi:MAG: LD-carboxypeptidase [Eubacteriaceae bacterium]|nr:LD-carboxypeptidase [Eubacteriaceae bacterium]